jgi:hypothetical protein
MIKIGNIFKGAHSKLKKTLFFLITTILIFVVVIILFISPIAKYLVEKYDEKYTGRQITMNWAYVNVFTGYAHFSNLTIYEYKSDSIFFSAEGLSASISMRKLFSKTYEISDITLNKPKGIVILDNKEVNFNDLIERFTPKDTTPSNKPPVRISLLNIKVKEGEFHYFAKLIPVRYFIKNVNIESPGFIWNVDSLATKFSFASGIGGGDANGHFIMNTKNNDYYIDAVVRKFDLDIIEQYLKDFSNYGTFTANLDADIKAKGNFGDRENITATGQLAVNDFHFGKNPHEDYASFEKVQLAIIELSPKNHKYIFDSISVIRPYFKYERYDHLDNIQMIFGKKGSNITAAKDNHEKFNLVIEIARYVNVLAKNFFKSPYKIDRLAIYKADIAFNDFSISEEFSVHLNPLTITADSIDKNHDRVHVYLKSGIQPYGNTNLTLSIDPNNSDDFDIQATVQKVPASLFNPYLITYTSFPLDRGTIEVNSSWTVRNGNIQSANHLVIIDPRTTKRLRNKDNKWIPIPLIMSFVRERGDVIDYEIPITGNLKNPRFHLHDVLMDLIENIFIKPPTTPYRLEVKTVETKIEKSLTIKWDTRHSSLSPKQERFIQRMVNFLKKNPDASIEVHPKLYTAKEKEYILFYEAKKKYYLAVTKKNIRTFNKEDAEQVDKLSVKDAIFVHYMEKQINDSLAFTIQDKCARFVSPGIINKRYSELNKEREMRFMSYFREGGVEKQIKITPNETVVPYNGFSFYKIKYNGELPKPLLKAYEEMNELNDKTPRNKFKKERRKYTAAL